MRHTPPSCPFHGTQNCFVINWSHLSTYVFAIHCLPLNSAGPVFYSFLFLVTFDYAPPCKYCEVLGQGWLEQGVCWSLEGPSQLQFTGVDTSGFMCHWIESNAELRYVCPLCLWVFPIQEAIKVFCPLYSFPHVCGWESICCFRFNFS